MPRVELKCACKEEDIKLLLDACTATTYIEGDIVELGSFQGASAFAMAMRAPHKRVFACDLFGGLPYPEQGIDTFDYLADVNFAEIQENAKNFPNVILVRGRHEDTVPKLPVEKISYLFMDSDWYESHVVGLKHLAPKVQPGGIIAFHDWAFPGVRQAAFETLSDEWEMMQSEFEFIPEKQGMAFLRRME